MKRLLCVSLTFITMLLAGCEKNNPTSCGVHYETKFEVQGSYYGCNDQEFHSATFDTCLVEKGGWLKQIKDYGKNSRFGLVRYDRGPHPKNHCKVDACPDGTKFLMFKSKFYSYARRSNEFFKNQK